MLGSHVDGSTLGMLDGFAYDMPAVCSKFKPHCVMNWWRVGIVDVPMFQVLEMVGQYWRMNRAHMMCTGLRS
jgi:hypothetical protein